MENITKERLMQAGWYLGRIIDISEFENKYKEIGLYLDSEYFVTLLSDYGIESMAYPIGLKSRGNLIIVMPEDGVFYSFTDGCLCMNGKCAEDMLDCVVGETRLPEFIE